MTNMILDIINLMMTNMHFTYKIIKYILFLFEFFDITHIKVAYSIEFAITNSFKKCYLYYRDASLFIEGSR